MIEKIKQIIADNSEGKNFCEYGKGIFTTNDAVDKIAKQIEELYFLVNADKRRDTLSDFLKYAEESADYLPCEPSELIDGYLGSL